MSKLLRDTVYGKRISVVYDADSNVMVRGEPRAINAKMIMRKARKARTAYSCRARLGEATLLLLSRYKGVSVFSQIQNSLQSVSDAQESVDSVQYFIAFATDQHIYVATVQNQVVQTERVFHVETDKADLLELLASSKLFYIQTNARAELVLIEHGALVWSSAIDLWAYKYSFKPIALVMARQGLPHPQQAMALLFILAVGIAGYFYQQSHRRAVEETARLTQISALQTIDYDFDHSGADYLNAIAQQILELRLSSVEENSPGSFLVENEQAQLTGSWTAGYPYFAESYFNRYHGNGLGSFSVSERGWNLQFPLATTPVFASVETVDKLSLIADLFDSSLLLSARFSITGSAQQAGTGSLFFSYSLDDTNVVRLNILAGTFESKPIKVLSVSCAFSNRNQMSCEIQAEARHAIPQGPTA